MNNKFTSGRFILTIVGSISFLMIVLTLCKILIDKAVHIELSDITPWISNVFLILSNIFTFYFVKSNLQNNHNGNEIIENEK